jgi:hypothetical protein
VRIAPWHASHAAIIFFADKMITTTKKNVSLFGSAHCHHNVADKGETTETNYLYVSNKLICGELK